MRSQFNPPSQNRVFWRGGGVKMGVVILIIGDPNLTRNRKTGFFWRGVKMGVVILIRGDTNLTRNGWVSANRKTAGLTGGGSS